MSLSITIRSEFYKTKRTASFYLAIIGGLIMPVIVILDVIFDGIRPENKKDIFNILLYEGFKNTAFVFLPMFLVLISTLLPQLEFKNNAWKQVLASPQPKFNIFVAKYLNIHLLIVVFVVAYYVFMLIAAVTIHFLEPSLNVLDQPLDLSKMLSTTLNAYVSFLAMGAIQFWMGLRFRNFIVPMGVGLSLWFVGSLMVLEHDWEFAKYFPYSFHLYSLSDKYSGLLPTIQRSSVIFATVALFFGYLNFSKREHKG